MKLNNVILNTPGALPGYRMPAFDRPAMLRRTAEAPTWLHFGSGNIFRMFPAVLCQRLLNDGLWDTGSFDYELLTGLDLDINKKDGLDYWFSAMNHAMVITGVSLDENGAPVRWKIENSWGDEKGNKGYYVCSDSWFDQYVYQAVVSRDTLGDKVSLLDQKPIVLNPWDPMGSLAD